MVITRSYLMFRRTANVPQPAGWLDDGGQFFARYGLGAWRRYAMAALPVSVSRESGHLLVGLREARGDGDAFDLARDSNAMRLILSHSGHPLELVDIVNVAVSVPAPNIIYPGQPNPAQVYPVPVPNPAPQ